MPINYDPDVLRRKEEKKEEREGGKKIKTLKSIDCKLYPSFFVWSIVANDYNPGIWEIEVGGLRLCLRKAVGAGGYLYVRT